MLKSPKKHENDVTSHIRVDDKKEGRLPFCSHLRKLLIHPYQLQLKAKWICWSCCTRVFRVDTLLFLDDTEFKRHRYDENSELEEINLSVIRLLCTAKRSDLYLSVMNVYPVHCLLKLGVFNYVCPIHISTWRLSNEEGWGRNCPPRLARVPSCFPSWPILHPWKWGFNFCFQTWEMLQITII